MGWVEIQERDFKFRDKREKEILRERERVTFVASKLVHFEPLRNTILVGFSKVVLRLSVSVPIGLRNEIHIFPLQSDSSSFQKTFKSYNIKHTELNPRAEREIKGREEGKKKRGKERKKRGEKMKREKERTFAFNDSFIPSFFPHSISWYTKTLSSHPLLILSHILLSLLKRVSPLPIL